MSVIADPRGVWVKICGVTRPEDATAAIEAGASAIGLMFAESSRRIDLAHARLVRAAIPDSVVAVGVFDDTADADAIGRSVAFLHLGGVQLPASAPCSVPSSMLVLRTVRCRDARDLETDVDGILHVDAYVEGELGGTGTLAPWDAIAQSRLRGPFVLSGGLRPGNVGEAVSRLRPAGVDVSSGVEASPGVKDHARIRAFIDAARGA